MSFRPTTIRLSLKWLSKVLFGRWSGTEVVLDGEEFIIMEEGDLMRVIGA